MKAQLLTKDPFTFLRGAFSRWMQLFPAFCKKAAGVPIVLSVGDLHAANFGTRAMVKEVLDDLRRRKPDWLMKSAEKMVRVTLHDWRMWKAETGALLSPMNPA